MSLSGLYLCIEKHLEFTGVHKKVVSQKKALEYNGFEMKLAYTKESSDYGSNVLVVNDKIIINYGKGIRYKINHYTKFSNLLDYIFEEKFDFLYIRYTGFATPFFVNFLKKVNKKNIRLFLEIPTYPFDKEHKGLWGKIRELVDKLSRRNMVKYLEKIITISDHDSIWGKSTIKISNGIDFDSVLLKRKQRTNSNSIHLIGVASLELWHGFDRLVLGLADYYKKNVIINVYFNIISGKGDNEILASLKKLVLTNGLSDYVKFSGAVFGDQLDKMFDEADIGIGSLGCHRIGIFDYRILKNREYAARGIPFGYSGNDFDFDARPYTIKIPADETPVNIDSIVRFYQNLTISPDEIRNSVKNLVSWNVQMAKVAKCIIEKETKF